MKFEQFEIKYKAIINPEGLPDENIQFENDTSIISKVNGEHIWTVIKGDQKPTCPEYKNCDGCAECETMTIINGLHHVDNLYYIFCVNPCDAPFGSIEIDWD